MGVQWGKKLHDDIKVLGDIYQIRIHGVGYFFFALVFSQYNDLSSSFASDFCQLKMKWRIKDNHHLDMLLKGKLLHGGYV